MKTQIAVLLLSTFLQTLKAADPSVTHNTASASKSETRVVRQSGSSSSAPASASSSGGGGGYPTGGGGGGYAPQPSYGVPDDTNYDYGDERYNYHDDGYYQQPFQFPQPSFPQFPVLPQGNLNFADFGRIGGSGNGRVYGVSSSSGIYAGPDGKVTTFQSNSGGPPSIQTRLGKPGKVNGVYSSSGFSVGPDGKVSSYKDSGHF